MTYIPFSPQTGAKYRLTGPDGTIAVFNDPTDANYVGMLTDVTGLDSANVRESGDDLVQSDGGWHGNFYYGRRPITLTGEVFGHASVDARTARLDRLIRASNAMRGDATLWWQNSDMNAVPMQVLVRRQQPLRISGAWVKNFQLQLVSADAPLFSAVTHQQGGANVLAESFENNTDFPANWTATNGSLTWSTAQALVNTHSAMMTSNGAGILDLKRTTVSALLGGSLSAPADNWLLSPFTNDLTHTFTASVRAATTVRSWQPVITWYSATATTLRTDTGTAVADTNTGWTALSLTVVPPAGAVAYRCEIKTTTTPANTEVHYTDGWSMANSATAAVGFSNQNVVVENKGNYPAYPLLAFSFVSNVGVSVITSIQNTTNNTSVSLNSRTYLANSVTIIDALRHTATDNVFNTGPGTNTPFSANAYLNFTNSGLPWLRLDPGMNTLSFVPGGTNSSGLWVAYQDAWI